MVDVEHDFWGLVLGVELLKEPFVVPVRLVEIRQDEVQLVEIDLFPLPRVVVDLEIEVVQLPLSRFCFVLAFYHLLFVFLHSLFQFLPEILLLLLPCYVPLLHAPFELPLQILVGQNYLLLGQGLLPLVLLLYTDRLKGFLA